MPQSIVLVGASAGGVDALKQFVAGLPRAFPAAVVIVLHVPADAPSVLPQILARSCELVVRPATDGATLEPRTVYVAPPDHHTLVDGDKLRLTRGPRVNGHRPAFDPLLQSGARWWGKGAIGVVLSGSLDDGTAGMATLRSVGGAVLAQDPDDAVYPSMPRSVIDEVGADRVLPAAGLGGAAAELVGARDRKGPPGPYPTADLELSEESMREAKHDMSEAGVPPEGPASGFTCPDCHGSLWELQENKLLRYRCRVGHVFSPGALVESQSEALEEALWTAFRALEENAALSARLAERAVERQRHHAAHVFVQRRDNALARAKFIQRVIEQGRLGAPVESDDGDPGNFPGFVPADGVSGGMLEVTDSSGVPSSSNGSSDSNGGERR